jgi:hypothetical protein
MGLIAAGCGGASGAGASSGGCGQPVQERLDPRSTQHVLPGAPEPPYRSDPPTSGAHRVGNLPQGAVAAPISRPVQVALLEKGGVLIQYRNTIAGADAAALQALTAGSPKVVVAPGAALPSAVVATAWTWKLQCASGAEPARRALAGFVSEHAGNGPES